MDIRLPPPRRNNASSLNPVLRNSYDNRGSDAPNIPPPPSDPSVDEKIPDIRKKYANDTTANKLTPTSTSNRSTGESWER